MKAIYKFEADLGRQGELEGLFVATKEQVETLISSGIEVYFGEVLGKHSEVYGTIDEDEITMITDNEEIVSLFEEHNISSGFNPFDYSVTSFDYEEYPELEEEYDEVEKLVNALIKIKNK